MKLYQGGDPMAEEPTRDASTDELSPKPKAPPRRRRALVAVGVVGLAAALGGAVAVPLVRARVGREIERRCELALGGTCKVGALSLKADGAHATDVRATTNAGALSAEIQRIDVTFGWWALLANRRQGLSVRVTHAVLTDAAPVDHAAVEVMVMHGLHQGELLPRNTYVADFDAQDSSLRVPIAPFIGARVEGIALHSKSDGSLSLRWQDAAVDAGPFAAVSSGPCTVRRAARERQAAVDCASTHQTVDLDALMNAGMLSLGLRVLGAAVGRVPGLP